MNNRDCTQHEVYIRGDTEVLTVQHTFVGQTSKTWLCPDICSTENLGAKPPEAGSLSGCLVSIHVFYTDLIHSIAQQNSKLQAWGIKIQFE